MVLLTGDIHAVHIVSNTHHLLILYLKQNALYFEVFIQMLLYSIVGLWLAISEALLSNKQTVYII